jgi:hypothetical protein
MLGLLLDENTSIHRSSQTPTHLAGVLQCTFNIAEDLVITDRKQYARHRRNNILVDIEFYVSDMFDVATLERYIVSSYRLNDRLPNSLFS